MLTPSRLFFYFNLILIALVFIIGLNPNSFNNQKLASGLIIYQGEKVTFRGRVCREAETDYKIRRLTICLPEKILVTTALYPEYDYADVLEISGKIEEPPILENFDYARYLGKSDIYSVMYYPKLTLIAQGQTNNLFQLFYFQLLKLKKQFETILERSIKEPELGLAKAIFLGMKRQILADDKEAFTRSGLSHLIAISGTHIVVLSALIVKLSSALRMARSPSLFINFIFLAIYPLFTGLSASALRAGLMGSLVLLAFYEGRLIISIRALVFSAALMLIFNPKLLREDLGFQLSFLAVLGIIYLYPIFCLIKRVYKKYLTGTILKILNSVTDVLSITLACQIMTLPILLINFQQLSMVSPLANVLVIWTFPFLFVFLILPLLPAAIFPILGPWFFAPAYFLLAYIFSMARYLANFSWAVKQVKDFNWLDAGLFYLFLSLVIFLFRKKVKPERQTKTPL